MRYKVIPFILISLLLFAWRVSAEEYVSGNKVEKIKLFDFLGLTTAPSVSPSNRLRSYYNKTDNKWYYSKNGGAYVEVGTGSGDSWGDAVDANILPTGADDTYDIGSATAQFKNGYFDGTLEADVITEGGSAVYNSSETPGGELGGTFASFTIDDSVAVSSWNLTTPTITTSLTTDSKTISEAEIGLLDGGVEGTEILSTGEGGSSKYLREDGDGTCSWQTVVSGVWTDTDDGATIAQDLTIEGNVSLNSNLTVNDDFVVDTVNSRVGVGNVSPTVALDVTGDVETSGNLTIVGTGDPMLTIHDTGHLRPTIRYMRDGDAYYDYRTKVDSGYFQTHYSADDGDNWTLIYEFQDDTFDFHIVNDLIVDGDLTGSIGYFDTIMDADGSGPMKIIGDLSVSNLLSVGSILMNEDIVIATILSPSNVSINTAKPIIYTNWSDQTKYLHEIRAVAYGYDDTAFTLKIGTYDLTNMTIEGDYTVDSAINCTNGSDPYGVTIAVGGMTDNDLSPNSVIWVECDGTDDPEQLSIWLKIRSYE